MGRDRVGSARRSPRSGERSVLRRGIAGLPVTDRTSTTLPAQGLRPARRVPPSSSLAPTPTSRPRLDVAPPAPGRLSANGPARFGQQPVLTPAVDGVWSGIESLPNLCQPNRLMLGVQVRHRTPRPRCGRRAIQDRRAHNPKLTRRHPRRVDRGAQAASPSPRPRLAVLTVAPFLAAFTVPALVAILGARFLNA